MHNDLEFYSIRVKYNLNQITEAHFMLEENHRFNSEQYPLAMCKQLREQKAYRE